MVLLGVCALCQIVHAPLGYAAAGVLAIAGLAHGAVEESADGLSPVGVGQGIIYLVAAAAIFCFWVASPLAALALFLGLSAWHFTVSSEQSRLPALSVALIAIGGSALFRSGETWAIFELMVGGAVPQTFMVGLSILGAAGCLLAAASVLRDRNLFLELASAVIAVAVLQPVLAVAFVFFALHALPVTLRLCRSHGADRFRRAALLPTALAASGMAILAFIAMAASLDVRFVAAILIALATPHMLIDRLGLGFPADQSKRLQNSA